ncbi:MAG: hypothetical protein [Bacteroides phage LoVEphage]|nr:MAG: hypothetical protein [Bacteroides phage LoVEphage]
MIYNLDNQYFHIREATCAIITGGTLIPQI